MLNRKYDRLDSKTAEGAGANSADLPQKKSVQFSDSALARYLGALFYLGEGNADSARIEFARLQAAFAANANVYSHSFPKSVEAAQNVPADKARLNIIGFTRLSPIKEEKINQFYFPFLYNNVLKSPRFKLPVLVKRPGSINRIEIVIGNEKINLELLEDIGAVIQETYNARFSRVVIKTYIRTMLKYAAIDIAAVETIRRTDSDIVTVLAIASALAAREAFDATESADIRMSRYLPDKAYIGGINLDPGNYDIESRFYKGNQLVAGEERNVNVRANGLNLVEAVSLK
jgi:hypothetical protein